MIKIMNILNKPRLNRNPSFLIVQVEDLQIPLKFLSEQVDPPKSPLKKGTCF
jgi:hypothetical protein